MSLHELMSQDVVACRYNASSKKQLLQHLTDLASDVCDVPARAIMDAIMKREKLGNTCIGDGAAIPHALIEGLDSDIVLLATLEQPIAYDAANRGDVDIVCMVIGPVGATTRHLTTVAMVSRMLKDNSGCLRSATTTDALLAAIADQSGNSVAA